MKVPHFEHVSKGSIVIAMALIHLARQIFLIVCCSQWFPLKCDHAYFYYVLGPSRRQL